MSQTNTLHHLTSPGSKCHVNHELAVRIGRSSDFSHIDYGAFPVMMQTVGRLQPVACEPRDVSRGVTAAGTVQDSHLIPFSSLAPSGGREP